MDTTNPTHESAADDLRGRFLLPAAGVRGVYVRLSGSWRELLSHASYPAGATALLGESVAAATLFTGHVKVDGRLSIQARADDALLAVTIENPGLDPREPQRYQSLVALGGAGSLAEAFEDYFRQSEQLPTRLLLAADGEHAAGLMLQKLPGEEGDADAWARTGALFDTLGEAELLATPPRLLVHRLFHEEQPELLEERPVAFGCSCSEERVE